MTLATLLINIRARIKDPMKLAYKDEELIRYVNDAISALNVDLISAFDPTFTKKISLTLGEAYVPNDFVRLAGQYPAYISNECFYSYDSNDEFDMLYYAAKPSVSALTDVIPFSDTDIPYLIQMAAIYALNRNEFNVQQDVGILASLKQSMRSAKGL